MERVIICRYKEYIIKKQWMKITNLRVINVILISAITYWLMMTIQWAHS